ncbi:MAG: plastocyanin/azurin family copper-binding protein [Anaerolineae bacterium]|nr:plastocyanin/azurin family copper-binding protein [Anaerolineae bacterium]
MKSQTFSRRSVLTLLANGMGLASGLLVGCAPQPTSQPKPTAATQNTSVPPTAAVNAAPTVAATSAPNLPTPAPAPTATKLPTVAPSPMPTSPSPTAAPTSTAQSHSHHSAATPTSAVVSPTAIATKPSAPPAAPAKPASFAARISLFAFNPGVIEVSVGSTVVWTNNDLIDHSVTSGLPDKPDGAFDSGFFNRGQTFSFTFTKAGEYNYFCRRHTSMTGKVVVR